MKVKREIWIKSDEKSANKLGRIRGKFFLKGLTQKGMVVSGENKASIESQEKMGKILSCLIYE